MRKTLTAVWMICLAGVVAGQAPAQKPGLTPVAPKESSLRVRLEHVGRMPTNRNPTSPVVAGSQLLLIDQAGYLYRWDGARRAADHPPDRAAGREAARRRAADERGRRPIGRQGLRDVHLLDGTSDRAAPDVAARSRRVVPALRVPVRRNGAVRAASCHSAAGAQRRPHRRWVAVLDDGSVLFASGDNGDSYEDGVITVRILPCTSPRSYESTPPTVRRRLRPLACAERNGWPSTQSLESHG